MCGGSAGGSAGGSSAISAAQVFSHIFANNSSPKVPVFIINSRPFESKNTVPCR